jgi:hypothetical protein
MKIHLHGDSWCYLWPRYYENSDHIPGLLARNQPGVINFDPMGNTVETHGSPMGKSDAMDFYTMMFNYLGHELINGGCPGIDLETTIKWITDSDLQSDADLHVVMAPFMFRHADSLAKIPKDVLGTADGVNKWMSNEQVKLIKKLSNHAAITKTHYIIIGAHGPLSGKCDTVLNEYSHIMYHDWLQEFIWEDSNNYEKQREYLKERPQYFRFATTIDYKKVHLENWGEDVIGMISGDLESPKAPSSLWKLVYPDNGHPNAMVMHDMVGKIMKYADKLGIN